MPCIWLKNGIRLNVKKEALQDKEFMKKVREIDSLENTDSPSNSSQSPKKSDYLSNDEADNPLE